MLLLLLLLLATAEKTTTVHHTHATFDSTRAQNCKISGGECTAESVVVFLQTKSKRFRTHEAPSLGGASDIDQSRVFTALQFSWAYVMRLFNV